MRNRTVLSIILIAILIWTALPLADEGMWMLDQLNYLNWRQLEQRGLKLSPKDIQKMKDAVVIIDGGTGEFVSDKGLVLTNHHVAFGAIQYASRVGQNYIQTGFVAKSMADEIPIPTYEVLITKEWKDVTKEVLSAVKEGMTPLQRFEALQKRMEEIRNQYEKDEFTEARVVEVYSGIKYYLFIYEKFKDVRLVYAPPYNIGQYGGDIDNWMWPRHGGDFSLFRVYMSKDGKPAKYSKDNIPYTPKKYFPISLAGVKEGDFTFILGFPGTTYRYRTSSSIAYNQEIGYPTRMEIYRTALSVLDRLSENNPDIAIKVAGFKMGLNNVLKNNQGMLDGFKKLHLLEKKKHFENDFKDFLKTRPDLQKKYGNVLEEINQLYENYKETAVLNSWLGFARFIRLPNYIYTAYRYAQEKEKPEAEREPGYSEKDMKRMLESLKYRAKQYVLEVDKEMMKTYLKKLLEIPGTENLDFLKEIVQGKTGDAAKAAIDAYVDNLFDHSQFKQLTDVIPLYDKSLKDFQKMNDPLIQFAKKIDPVMKQLEKQAKEFNGAITVLRGKYMKALFAWKGNKLYPDANRTLRFTYGDVRGYSPRDAVLYLPKTSLHGVVEKNTGKPPFNAPEKLLQLEANRDFGPYMDAELNDVPVDFLHTTDITGGNSGSPVLNGRGELIGIAFDGNYEAMTSDYQFDNNITRTISVDSRYVLFILDKFSGTQNIIRELKLVGAPVSYSQ